MTLLEDPVVGDIAKKLRRTPAQVIPFSKQVSSSTFLFLGFNVGLNCPAGSVEVSCSAEHCSDPKEHEIPPHFGEHKGKLLNIPYIPILHNIISPNDVSCYLELSFKQNIK